MSDFTLNRTIIGDCRQTLGTLPEGLFQCCVTSAPTPAVAVDPFLAFASEIE